MRISHICCALLTGLTIALSPRAVAEDSTAKPHSVLPSTLVEYIHLQHHLFPEVSRQDIVKPLQGAARTHDLTREEQFYFAELLFLSLNAPAAHTEFRKIAGGDDWYGRFSIERLMLIEARVFDDPAQVSATLDLYRKKYGPDPSDIMGMYWGYDYLAGKLAADGNHDEVIALIEKAVAEVDNKAPYAVLALPRIHYASFQKAGRAEHAIELMKTARDVIERLKYSSDKTHDINDDEEFLFENAWHAKWFYRSSWDGLR